MPADPTALLRSADPFARFALADLCDEAGDENAAMHYRAEQRRPLSGWDGAWFAWCIGSGSGIGSGIGRGSGSGSGSGIGRGIGIGSGIGRGIGIGSGYGRGSGSGSETHDAFRRTPMRIGEAYLVHLGDWHTFVGRVTEQVAPGIYEMTACSKVSDTNNGDVWHELAAGDKRLRKAATYLHCKTPVMVPLTIAALFWKDKTPQEEGL